METHSSEQVTTTRVVSGMFLETPSFATTYMTHTKRVLLLITSTLHIVSYDYKRISTFVAQRDVFTITCRGNQFGQKSSTDITIMC
jgi:hypothetical protein